MTLFFCALLALHKITENW